MRIIQKENKSAYMYLEINVRDHTHTHCVVYKNQTVFLK